MVSGKQKNSVQLWQIAKVNLRHNFLPLFILSIAVTAIAPLLFGTTNLDKKASAVPLEMLISTIGIILLVPIFQPEQDTAIEDVIASKYVDMAYIYFIRVIYSMTGIALLVAAFCAFLSVQGCEITVSLVFGAIADAVFLGSTGLFTSAVTNNLSVSFMIPMLYYLFNITMQDKLGNFDLFSMMHGNHAPDIWLFAAGIFLTVFSVRVKRVSG